MTSPHHPGRIALQNVITGEIRHVRFGQPEHHALRAKRHPEIWHRPLWAQLNNPPQPEEDSNDGHR